MVTLGIDPGPEKSACVEFDGTVLTAQYLENDAVRRELHDIGPSAHVAIEFPEARGGAMPVSQDLLDTAGWAGTFNRDRTCQFFKPREIRIHFCGVAKATRAHVRQALIDQLGPVGTSIAPGPLYEIGKPRPHAEPGDGESVSSHLWDALAVAVMGYEKAREKEREMGAK